MLSRPNEVHIDRWADEPSVYLHKAGRRTRVGSVAAVRNSLGERVDLYGQLVSRYHDLEGQDPLAELYAPTTLDVIREDLPADEASWARLLEEEASSSYANARTLVELWTDATRVAGEEPDAPDMNRVVERVSDSLSAVTAALEGELPWSSRASGEATLFVSRDDEGHDVLCWWQDSDVDGEPLSLLALLRHRFDLVGRFRHESLERLALTAAEAVLDLTVELPCFSPASHSSAKSAKGRATSLTWLPPALQRDGEELAMES